MKCPKGDSFDWPILTVEAEPPPLVWTTAPYAVNTGSAATSGLTITNSTLPQRKVKAYCPMCFAELKPG